MISPSPHQLRISILPPGKIVHQPLRLAQFEMAPRRHHSDFKNSMSSSWTSLTQLFELPAYMASLADVPQDGITQRQRFDIVHKSRTQTNSPEERLAIGNGSAFHAQVAAQDELDLARPTHLK
jgi:hypothetical protein